MVNEGPTYRQFVSTFADFLTVSIHTILYERSIYPATTFLSARKYNFAVRQNRHPKVCEWINDAVAAVEAELIKGVVEKISVVIYDSTNQPLERFVFDVSRFPVVPSQDLDKPLVRDGPGQTPTDILPVVNLEEQFRATMSKLSNCRNMLRPIADGCAFTIAMDLREDGQAPLAHPQPWVPVQQSLSPASDSERQHSTTVPVRSIVAGEMVFETWIEENENITTDKSNDSFATSDF